MPRGGATAAVAPVADDDDTQSQRSRIVETSLRLMSENGVHATSMRRLADACGLNVATLYHYFPSKADLLTAVIAHRSYADLLSELPPIDGALPVAERLATLLAWIWTEMGSQDDMWRLLLGESLRGDTQAMASAAELSATFETALDRWLDELFPDWATPRDDTARVLRGIIYGFFVEHLPLSADDRSRLLERRATEVATVLVGPMGA